MSISPSTEQPGLCWMPPDGHHPKVIILGVAHQPLDWDYQGVLQQVIVHHPVGHCDVTVVPTGGKERVTFVELDVSDCIYVVPQHLVRHG